VLPDDPTQNLSIAVCPVPTEQLPLNEYEDLKESWFFRWATLERSRYVSKIVWVWLWSWAIAAPIAAASFSFEKYPAKFLLTSAGGGILLLGLVLIRLYLGWSYVSSRLMDAKVFYEESGWYDGQTWVKPAAVLARDRLVVSYQIQPILKQMQITFAVLVGLLGIGTIVWHFLN
jgi:hypothetical protein